MTQFNAKQAERPNVLILNFDAISRAHFLRRLPKTAKYLESVHESGSASLFQFFRYHSVGVTTVRNLKAMYAGDWEGSGDDGTTLWELYTENGYVTAVVDNSCLEWTGKYQDRTTSKPPDHQFIVPFCLPEAHPLDWPFGLMKGPFSIRRRCLSGKYVHTYAFDWMEKFHNTYKDQPKFIVADFNEGHESTGDVIAVVDDDLVAFLRKIDFNNTMLFLLSDHGLHMGLWFMLGTYAAISENRLALLNVLIPNGFLGRYPQVRNELENSAQTLVTPLDLFETFKHIVRFPDDPIEPPRKKNVRSLFSHIPENRNCSDANIEEYVCICKGQGK